MGSVLADPWPVATLDSVAIAFRPSRITAGAVVCAGTLIQLTRAVPAARCLISLPSRPG